MTACAQVSVPPTHAGDNFVSFDGTRLRYRDEGRGPAVMLVHGWTLDLEMWDPQVSALRGTFRLIRFDRRGHGLSAGSSTPERDSEDLERLCKHLGLTRVALIGMSQGVRGVLGFACAAPSRISAVILDGPPALASESDPEVPVRQYAELVRAHGMEAFRREWARHRLMQLRTRDPAHRALVAAMIGRYAGNDLRSAPSPAVLMGGHVRPQAVAAPTLVLSGELDLPGRRLAARRLAARLPDAELAVISGAAHLPNLDSPDVYSKLCRAFLLRHCGPHGPS
jgi:pimeloyl-[acyl-carrier protein] methyl ester esterase